MKDDFLSRIRRLNEILKKTGAEPVSFMSLMEEFSEILNANTYIAKCDGSILAYATNESYNCDLTYCSYEGALLPSDFTKKLLSYNDTVENEYDESPVCTFGEQGPCVYKDRYLTIVPIFGLGDRLGTLFFSKYGGQFSDDDIILCEYSSAIVVQQMLRYVLEERNKATTDLSNAKMAISTLSFSEAEAVKKIFNEVDVEGLVIASKIANEAQITRSVVSNALRKLESAGIIETRSLGMKGTYIKIINGEIKKLL